MKQPIKLVLLSYNAQIKDHEVPWFRGAILDLLGENKETIFHNHLQEKSYNYKYPLVQYKNIGGKASILLINNAIDELGLLIKSERETITIGKRNIDLYPATLSSYSCTIEKMERPISYSLESWIPLNSDNYNKYNNLHSIDEKVEMLNSILVGNLISCLKGLNIFVDFEIEAEIQNLTPKKCTLKGTEFRIFDAEFLCNMKLPEFIGIGKSSSKGFGIITTI